MTDSSASRAVGEFNDRACLDVPFPSPFLDVHHRTSLHLVEEQHDFRVEHISANRFLEDLGDMLVSQAEFEILAQNLVDRSYPTPENADFENSMEIVAEDRSEQFLTTNQI